MIGTYASAALICAASLLVGRAAALARRAELLVVAGAGCRVSARSSPSPASSPAPPGTGPAPTLGPRRAAGRRRGGRVARLRYPAPGAWRAGLPVAIAVALVLAIPFAVSGHWGLLGVGLNNDLGLHLAWAEWLRSGFGPAPDPGYPLGPARPRGGDGGGAGDRARPGLRRRDLRDQRPHRPHRARRARRHRPGAAAAGGDDGRPPLPRRLLLRPGAPSRRLAEALFVLAFASFLLDPRRARRRALGPSPLPARAAGLAGGIFFSYSFAGLAWPVATLALWSLTKPAVRRALRPRALLRFLLRPLTLVVLVVLAALALAALVGPFGFASSFNKVAGSNTYGPVSAVEALGVWPTSNYRLDAVGGAHLTGLAGRSGSWRCWSESPGGWRGAKRRSRSRSAPALASTSPRCPPAATTRRRRR